jgi:hypothetical protein
LLLLVAVRAHTEVVREQAVVAQVDSEQEPV